MLFFWKVNKHFSVFSCCGTTGVSHTPTHTHTPHGWTSLTPAHRCTGGMESYLWPHLSGMCLQSEELGPIKEWRSTCTHIHQQILPTIFSNTLSEQEKATHSFNMCFKQFIIMSETLKQDIGQPLWSETAGCHHGPGNKPVTLVILYHLYFMSSTL